MDSADRKVFELAAAVLEKARSLGLTLGCAESCTGGLIASALTEVPGSSDVFVGGIVSYWVDVKESVLHVDPAIIEKHGVVSTRTAEAMALGAREILDCDMVIATTGIAGPSGALPGKPVGTVCFGVTCGDQLTSFTTCEGESRAEVRALAVVTALRTLADALNAQA